jgi:hypothetical protein
MLRSIFCCFNSVDNIENDVTPPPYPPPAYAPACGASPLFGGSYGTMTEQVEFVQAFVIKASAKSPLRLSLGLQC